MKNNALFVLKALNKMKKWFYCHVITYITTLVLINGSNRKVLVQNVDNNYDLNFVTFFIFMYILLVV